MFYPYEKKRVRGPYQFIGFGEFFFPVKKKVWGPSEFIGSGEFFFTLNRHDSKSPLLIVFGHGERYGFRRLSLDWDEPEMQRYFDTEKAGNAHPYEKK